MRAAPWGLGVLLLCCASNAGAASWKLHYAHPRSVDCPSAAALKTQVNRRLGYTPWNDDGPGSVEANIVRAGRALVLHVNVVSAKGEPLGHRELRGQPNRCAELVDAAALTISIAIDPLAVEETQRAAEAKPGVPTPQPPMEATPLPPDVVEPPTETVFTPWPAPPEPARPTEKPAIREAPPSPRVDRSPAWTLRLPRIAPPTLRIPDVERPRLHVGMLTTFSTATAPHPVPGAALHLNVRWTLVSAALEARAEMPGSLTFDDATVQSQLTSVALVPCVHGGPGLACVVGIAGIRHVQGYGAGFLEGRSASVPFVAVGARVGAQYAVTRHVTALVGVDLYAVPLLARLKDARTGAALWTQPPVTALAFVGVLVSPP